MVREFLAIPRTVGVCGDWSAAGMLTLAEVKLGAIYVPPPDDEDVLAFGPNRAVALVDMRRARARGSGG